MALALAEARSAAGHDDVPVGAVVVGPDGQLLGQGHNERERRGDPTAHAEILALRAASAATGRWRLSDATLVVTLEPCAMCAGALVAARVARCVFGAWDDKAGACGSVWDLPRDPRSVHRVEIVGGVEEPTCARVLREFFAGRR
jgi:tRNA(adenine34) deaminase